jgi:hypothetical protein
VLRDYIAATSGHARVTLRESFTSLWGQRAAFGRLVFFRGIIQKGPDRWQAVVVPDVGESARMVTPDR